MIKILIVEDEEAISDLIRMHLTRAGYGCEQAFDEREAADFIAGKHYDLVLLDIMLPEIGGYESLDYIKMNDTPVIFITAMGELQDCVRGLRAGRMIILRSYILITLIFSLCASFILRASFHSAYEREVDIHLTENEMPN